MSKLCMNRRFDGTCRLDEESCAACGQLVSANTDLYDEVHLKLDKLHKKTHRSPITTFGDMASAYPGAKREHHEAIVAVQQHLTFVKGGEENKDNSDPDWF